MIEEPTKPLMLKHSVRLRSTWLLYALLCIVLWGIWGFLSKLGSDRISPQQLQILFTIGIVPTSLLAWAQLGFKVETDRRGAIYGILNGVFTGLGMLAYYEALSGGKASVVGPFTALFPLLTLALAFAILRERINRIQAAGMVMALAAIIILSY
jgi:bacterial/archaeal transporter family protein